MTNKDDCVYLDHAATTPLDVDVFEKIKPYLMQQFGNADSPHSFGRAAMTAVDKARDRLAELLNAKPSELYFTSGGTESDNWAVLGGAYAKAKEGKKHVLLSSIEHHAVLSAGERLLAQGFDVEYIPVNEGGMVELNAVKSRLRPDTALVGVMAVNNETGVVQPYREIAKLARQNGSLSFVDAVQAAPYMPIDVKAWGVDMLSISSHKFYGPKGVGALYIKSGVKVEKLVAGGEQERGMRGGTLNVAGVVGLSAAYEKAVATMQQNNEKITALKNSFLQQLSALDGWQLNGKGEISPSVLNLQIDGVENTALLYAMDLQGVAFAAGSACASASVKPSHVLLAMGLSDEQAKHSVRLSFGKNNTQDEIDRAAELFIQTVKKLRKN